MTRTQNFITKTAAKEAVRAEQAKPFAEEDAMTDNKRITSRFDLAEMTDDRAAKIEAMAEALCDFDVDNNGGYVWGHRGDSWGSDYENGRDYYREMAAAALGALQLWEIDATLDSVHPSCWISDIAPYDDAEWCAEIRWPEQKSAVGYGPTRIAAIRAAVAQAKGERR